MRLNIKPLLITMLLSLVVLTGCNPEMRKVDPGKGSAPMLIGPGVVDNHTPYTIALHCLKNQIINAGLDKQKKRVAVGKFPDYTGKISDRDGGYRVTQGAALMVSSALGVFKKFVQQAERVDTSVYQFELALANEKLVGDRATYKLPNGDRLNYRPKLSGSVLGSQYYVTGGVTELNYNISSNGAELGVAGIYGGYRTYTLSVGVDMRLVRTTSMEVVETTTLMKHITGYETKLGAFRFFGSELFDLNLGEKNDEPFQMGVRAVIEMAVMEMIAYLYNVNPGYCIAESEALFAAESQKTLRDPAGQARKIKYMTTAALADTIEPVQKKSVRRISSAKKAPATRLPRRSEAPAKRVSYGGACAVGTQKKPLYQSQIIDPLTPGFYVQLASFKTVASNQKELRCLKERHPELTRGKSFVIAKTRIRGGSERRVLLSGPMNSTEAGRYCSAVKKKGLDCFVRQVSG